MRYLLISLLSLFIFSCDLDSYVAPGQPVAPQSEVKAIPLPESGRPVPGADYYFNSYSYIRVYDSGNKADILTFGPDKDKTGEFLRYTLVNTPDPGAAADGSEASLAVDTYWGSYEIIGSDIDIYSLYDYSVEYSPSNKPYSERLGVTVRNNTSPFKGQYSFDLSSDALILTFDGASYIRMDQYVEDAMTDAQSAADWSDLEALDFARVLYLNVLLTQSVIPGYGGFFRYTELVSNLVSAIINEEGTGDIILSTFSSLYGEGQFRDSWTPPIDTETESIPSTILLKMNNNHQVLSHMIVNEPLLNHMTQTLGKDGTGLYYGSFDVNFTKSDGSVNNIALYMGSVSPLNNFSSYLELTDSVVSGFTKELLGNDPLEITIDDVSLGLSAPSGTDYHFLNPGNYTLPATE